MKKANIKRLRKAADLMEKAAELIDRVTETDSTGWASDDYCMESMVKEARLNQTLLRSIVKVAEEDGNG